MSNLTISDKAKRRILEMCEKRKATTGSDVIPAIMWIDTKLNPHLARSCVGIGFYNEHQRVELAENDIRSVDGFEYVLAVSQEAEALFLGKTLDYRENEFLLD